MGNLFSRAIKRFTQCSNAANQLPSREQQESAAHDQGRQDQDSRPIVQSIPVGQSIDSTDYASFESSGSGTPKSRSQDRQENVSASGGRAAVEVGGQQQQQQQQRRRQQPRGEQENEQHKQKASKQTETGDQKEPEVEEAVIKIQALVRGHLTRKALKDAQQQAATPPPHALGQSQFDADSLTKNPPSGVFLGAAPPLPPQGAAAANVSSAGANSRVPPLESIAEDVEVAPGASLEAQAPSSGSRRKLSPINRSLLIEPGETGRSDSVSPVPSEANASIDLNCATPASASIDIMDHNIRPADPMASVLHHKPQATPAPASEAPSEVVAAAAAAAEDDERSRSSWASPRMVVDPPAPEPEPSSGPPTPASAPAAQSSCQLEKRAHSGMAGIQNSHSIDSTEAAAIRIQSAFRGYHTRKHSPYRRRSPATVAGAAAAAAAVAESSSSSPPPSSLFQQPLSLDSSLSNGNLGAGIGARSPLRDQADLAEAGEGNQPTMESSSDVDERLSRLQMPVRRLSRQRQRVDTDDSQTSSPPNRDGPPATAGANLESLSTTTLDEPSNDTCISTLALDSELDEASSRQQQQQQQQANLTRQDDDSSRGQPLRELDVMLAAAQSPDEGPLKMSPDQNLSIEMDTESSNLGAALSLNEEPPESELEAHGRQHSHQVGPGREFERESSLEDRSFGANLVADEQLASEAQRFVDQLVSEEDKTEAPSQMEGELERVTSQLEAALEEATEGADKDQLAEELANAILNEEEQRAIELDSDDIERRDPSGRGSDDRSKSPLIKTTTGNQEPALVSGGGGGGSMDDDGAPGAREQSQEQNQLRLAVESPDEAIGSGRSSPALISSNGGSGSSEEEEEEADGGGGAAAAAAAAKPGGGGAVHSSDRQVPGGQGGQGANKGKKKNRAKRKGRK